MYSLKIMEVFMKYSVLKTSEIFRNLSSLVFSLHSLPTSDKVRWKSEVELGDPLGRPPSKDYAFCVAILPPLFASKTHADSTPM